MLHVLSYCLKSNVNVKKDYHLAALVVPLCLLYTQHGPNI